MSDFHSQIFRHNVARMHDRIDPGGRHVERLLRDQRRPQWEQELAEVQEAAAFGNEFDEVEDDCEGY